MFCFNEYVYDYDERNGEYIIRHGKTIPSSFFKYYSLSETSVDALTNMYLYATHPNLFNDPFDCNEKLVKFNTWDDVNELYSPEFSPDFVREQFSCLEEALNFCQKAYSTILYRKLGLVSLSTRNDKCDMWALYAQNTGFCIELDIDKLPFRHFGPFPMNYSDSFKQIDVGEGKAIAMLYQTNIKQKCWEHEQEWRLYIPNPIGFDMKSFGENSEHYNSLDDHDRKFKYPLNALKSIILGIKFFQQDSVGISLCNEYDVMLSEKETLRIKVLDFLAKICSIPYLNLYICMVKLADEGKCEFVPIKIFKYGDYKYRIIEE